ncbi:MAG: leucine-rich repeat protein [Clostridia bacterium]|nr:leucine-rich repeat protein [Clostridia bacterium]
MIIPKLSKTLSILIAAAMLFALLPTGLITVSAAIVDSGVCGDNLTWELDDEGNLTIAGTGDMWDYNYYYPAPWGNDIKSVIIEDGVTSIGYNAFGDCAGLTSATIGNGVTSIGDGAFDGCTALTRVDIYDLAAWCGIECIPQNLLENAHLYLNGELITDLAIPEGVTSIGRYAFSGCSDLLSVTIPGSVTSIFDHAFYYCTSLTNVTIGSGVTSIGSWAFRSCTGLMSVTIPDSVTSIGSGAFYNTGYYNDESNWEDGVLYIGKWLIDGGVSGSCSIKAGTVGIADYAFNGRRSLKNVTIPDSVTSIGDSAFEDCTGLTSVTIPASVTSIGDYAFYRCIGLTRITIPDGVKNIGDAAFFGCSSLTSVTIPNSVTSIGERAFYACDGLTSVTIGSGVTSIGVNAFYNCIWLTKVDISDLAAWCRIKFNGGNSNPLTYAHCLYMNGNRIINLVIPDSVTCIGDYAFFECTNLSSITIPDSVTSIGEYAFYYYDYGGYKPLNVALKVYENSFAQQYAIDIGITAEIISKPVSGTCGDSLIWALDNSGNLTVSGTGDMWDYSIMNQNGILVSTAPWGLGIVTAVVDPGVTSVGKYAFYGCEGLISVTIGSGVTSIGNSAFSGCSALTGVSIPDGVTSIGNYAFYGCTNLIRASIPDGVTSIGNDAFAYYQDGDYKPLDVMLVASQNSYAHQYAVDNGIAVRLISGTCGDDLVWTLDDEDNLIIAGTGDMWGSGSWGKEVKSVTICDGVTSIGYAAFRGCTDLTSVTIPSSVTSISRYAFDGCTALTRVDISDLAAWCRIDYNGGSNPLIYAHNLYLNGDLVTELVIPDGVTSIGNYAFYKCTGLTSVSIPDSVTSIGECSFSGCAGLTSIEIPDSVTSIGYRAFYDCTGLTSVTIGNGVTSIGGYAFTGCTGLTSVTIPDGVTSIGESAFYNTGYYNDESNWEDGILYIGNWLIKAKEDKSGEYIIKYGTVGIADEVFRGCGGLTSVSIPESVTVISNHAFDGCGSLTSVNIPDSIVLISSFAFRDCADLARVAIPDSVTRIGYGTFCNCTALTSITIPDSVVYIGDYAFDGCRGLTSIKIGEGLTSIGNYVFEFCVGLTSVTIPTGVTNIGIGAFHYCRSLTSVTIPDGVTSIGKYAFEGCTDLTSVIIPDSVTSIEERAFYYYDYDTYKPLGVTLTVYENSYAHQYAIDNAFNYELITSGFKKGDADGDGEVTVGDALVALRISVRLADATESLLACCDTDGDGEITVSDALAILRVAVRLADSL